MLSFTDPAPLPGVGHEHFAFNDWETPVCFDNRLIQPLGELTWRRKSSKSQLDELETRLERLRALYEQYFWASKGTSPPSRART